MYRIQLQDNLRVCHSAALVDKFRTRKAAGLLAYLALHPGNHSREKLMELFWPELELDAARNALSTNLSHLRSAVEKGLGQPEGALIRATRDTIGLQPGSYTTERGSDPERLLPGFYDDWVLEARAKLATSRLSPLKIEPLPATLTPYLGREDLREQALELLKSTRLLTLVGTGGVGKTRLALETLRAGEAEGTPVIWVELASLTDPSGIVERIAAALSLDKTNLLVSTLRRAPLLLCLDNCEHLIHGAAKEAERLLKACPQLTILATSREPLNITGEAVLRLPGLSEAESAALFCARACLAKPGWQVGREERPLLSLLCLRLDGLPLALELAAAKLRTLSLSELVQRLEARLSVLTSGNRVAEPRQQTLRAAIGWSYDLLSAKEKELFISLAVFRGGWTSEYAERVCPGAQEDLLDALVDKSLIQVESVSSGLRYRFLETIREFAAEQLDKLPEPEQLSYQRAHMEVFRESAAQLTYDSVSTRQEALQQIAVEQDNFRAALNFCCMHCPEFALEIVNPLLVYLERRGAFQEIRSLLEVVLALPASQVPTKERALGLSFLANAYQALGDRKTARQILHLMDELHRVLGMPVWSLTSHAFLEFSQGHRDEARSLYCRAIEQARDFGNASEELFALTNYSQLLLAEGQLEAARAAIEECRRLPGCSSEWVSENLALASLLEGRLEGVREVVQAAIASYADSQSYHHLAYEIVHWAMFVLRDGNHEEAVRLYGASFSWCEHYGYIVDQPESGFREVDLASLRELLAPDIFQAAFEQGRAWSPDEILAQLRVCASAIRA
ncbi:ATP-binding protein [Armatimonas sp.]|uniref:ATP-binding protein n=1 Tax=Armatimonas sp. TaxID=1872638 RepID=UPI0037534E61